MSPSKAEKARQPPPPPPPRRTPPKDDLSALVDECNQLASKFSEELKDLKDLKDLKGRGSFDSAKTRLVSIFGDLNLYLNLELKLNLVTLNIRSRLFSDIKG